MESWEAACGYCMMEIFRLKNLGINRNHIGDLLNNKYRNIKQIVCGLHSAGRGGDIAAYPTWQHLGLYRQPHQLRISPLPTLTHIK
jgi:hypothetical protein